MSDDFNEFMKESTGETVSGKISDSSTAIRSVMETINNCVPKTSDRLKDSRKKIELITKVRNSFIDLIAKMNEEIIRCEDEIANG